MLCRKDVGRPSNGGQSRAGTLSAGNRPGAHPPTGVAERAPRSAVARDTTRNARTIPVRPRFPRRRGVLPETSPCAPQTLVDGVAPRLYLPAQRAPWCVATRLSLRAYSDAPALRWAAEARREVLAARELPPPGFYKATALSACEANVRLWPAPGYSFTSTALDYRGLCNT